MRSNIDHLSDEQVQAMFRSEPPRVEALRPVAVAWTVVQIVAFALLVVLFALLALGVL